ncbi:hypothetical protein IT575_04525 [bacterium]|nr:hypothetical protein [bacterium]
MKRIFLYTRGDSEFGMGHLYRCSWLLEALRAQQRPELELRVRCHDTAAARSFWSGESAISWLAEPQIDSSRLAPGDVCLVDWLESPADQVAAARSVGARLLLLEEHGPAQAQADIVVNCLTAALEDKSFSQGNAQVYEGSQWLQFSPRLTRLRGVAMATTGAMQAELKAPVAAPSGAGGSFNFVYLVMLSFGGSPRAELVRASLDCLASAAYDQQVMVMPAGAAWEAELRRGAWPFQVQALPAGGAFYDYLSAADLLVCAGGLTAYEAAFLGVPSVVLALNQHQLETARKLESAGCCFAPGLSDEIRWEALGHSLAQLIHNPVLRSEMSRKGQGICDGRGLLRTMGLLLDLVDGRAGG